MIKVMLERRKRKVMSKSIFKNAVYKTLLNFFNLIIPLIIGPYVVRVIGKQLMGRITYTESINMYFSICAGLGIYQYGIREISRIRDDKEKLSQLFTSLFILGFIANLIVTPAYLIYINMFFKGEPAFPVMLIYAFNTTLSIFYVEWMNEALEDYDFITIKTIIVRSIFIISTLLFIKNQQDFYKYVILNSVTLFLNYFISFVHIKRKVKFDFSNLRFSKHLSSLIFIVILSNANTLYTILDKVILGSYVGENAVSYYNYPYLVNAIINNLLLSIVLVTVPRLSNLLGNNDEKEYENLLNKICKTYLAILFPAAIGIFILSKEILILYGGGTQLVDATLVLKIFSLFMITSGFESIFTNQVMYVKRKEKVLVIFIVACGLINVGLKQILIHTGNLSPESAIATTTLANFLLITTEYLYINYKLKIKFKILDFDKIKYLLYSLMFIPISYGVNLIFKGFFSHIFFIILISGLYYFSVLYFTKDEILFLILSKFKRRKA